MKALNHFLIVNLFILLAFIFSSCEQTTGPIVNITPTKTADGTFNKANPERPFKGSISYVLQSLVLDGNGYLYAKGTGNLTHLGTCTTDEIIISPGYGKDTFTAADGSQIYMTWKAVGDGTFAWEIDGGTGRFEGATGSGICPPFTPSLVDLTYYIEYIGVIRY